MPVTTPSALRAQIARGTPASVYLLVGDDEAERAQLAADIAGLVDDELRVFNLERICATDRSASPAAIAEAARLLPMMADRRVVIVTRAERLLKPKRRGKGDADAEDDGSGSPTGDSDALEKYVLEPEPLTVLVFSASDVDRTRRLYKALQKNATIVECWGLKGSRDGRVDLRQAARQAEDFVRRAVAAAGQEIDAGAVRLIAERAGTDIARLRGDVDRLLLYAVGKRRIAISDAREVVSAEIAQDDWAVTNAIQRGDAPEALRELGLSLDSGAVPYMVLGQLAWFAREKLPYTDPRRVRPAIEALFRTDLDLKSSGGDPRVLLERVVVELCGAARRRLNG